MQKEKENILKQNTVLKQKLSESEELVGKLLGSEGEAEGNDQEGDDE